MPRPFRTRAIHSRTLRAALAAVLVAAGLVVTAPPPTASAATCSVVDYYVVTTGSPQELLRYTIGGRLVSSLTLPDPAADYPSFTDVATNADASEVYVKGDGPVLYAVNPSTGAFRRQPLTGPVLPETTSALTSLPDGRLLAGSYTKMYVIDPVTGASTLDPRELPAGQRLNGDLTVLADGDVLALTTATDRVAGAFSNLTRVHAEGPGTVLGTVRSGQSLTTSHGMAYLPSDDGTVRRLNPVPTAAGTGALPASPLYGLGGARTVGAASVQDSGVCRPRFGVSLSELTTTYGHAPQVIAYGLPAGATGTVTFTLRGLTVCSVRVSVPTTRCVLDHLDAGSYAVSARWSGGGDPASQSFTVLRAPGQFSIGLFDHDIAVGTAPRFRAYLPPATTDATGPVTIVVDGRVLCTIQLPDRSCTEPTDIKPGRHGVYASYRGDHNYTDWLAVTGFVVT